MALHRAGRRLHDPAPVSTETKLRQAFGKARRTRPVLVLVDQPA